LSGVVAQKDPYDQLKTQYDSLRKAENHEGALLVAKQMNAWALQNETDTSLGYGVNQHDERVYFNKSYNVTLSMVSDSLQNLYEKSKRYYDEGNLDSTYFYLSKIINLSKTVKFQSGDEKYLYLAAYVYYFCGDNRASADLNRIALKVALQNQSKYLPIIKNNLGFNLLNDELFGDAILIYQDAINDIKEKLKNKKIKSNETKRDSLLLSEMIDNYAEIYFRLKDYKSSIELSKLSENMRLAALKNDSIITQVQCRHLIETYIRLYKIEKKVDYLNRAKNYSDYYLIGNSIESKVTRFNLLFEILKSFPINNEESKKYEIFNELKIIYENGLNINLGFSLRFKYAKLIICKSDSEKCKLLNEIQDYWKSNIDYLSFYLEEYISFCLTNYNFHVCVDQIDLSESLEKIRVKELNNLNDFGIEKEIMESDYVISKLSFYINGLNEISGDLIAAYTNQIINVKSRCLQEKLNQENYYRQIDELREKINIRRRFLVKIQSDGISNNVKVNEINKEVDSLNKELYACWPEYAQQKKNLSITWDQVQQNLDNGEAAIEFVRFFNEDDSLYYYNALVLKPGEKYPILVKLCQENQLKLIQSTSGFSAYYPLIWQPMERALEDVKTIYYAPTGELYNIPFHALYEPKENGDQKVEQKTSKRGVIVSAETVKTEIQAEYLIDRYTLHQLTSTRYLAMGLKQKAQEPIAKSIAMVGGVNYDFVNSNDVKPKKQKSKRNTTRSSQSATGKLAYLEGTKLETEIIKDSVQTKQWKIEMFSSNDATEDNLVRLEGRHAKSILHIATHGYAFPEYDFKDTSINKNSLRYSYRYSTNPMVRSGLILAGGNWAWTGSDTLSKLGAEQNGILTALEVSQLNLKKTKLVVLSACETGLGKIEGSEGTFGLKRGFKLAGVEQMIVSLWSVPDKETMELMTLFYSDLTKTLNPVTSFQKAQKEMRNRYPTDPEKWAGFVLVR
jgi:CHAT domain-containing protein